MPQSSIKLIWSLSSCNFCPRNGIRTCQIKPGKLIPKLAAALCLDESVLESSEGICTCCLADIDMIIRAVAIRGAMKDHFLQTTESDNGQTGEAESSGSPDSHELDTSGQKLSANERITADSTVQPPALTAKPSLLCHSGVLPSSSSSTPTNTSSTSSK